MSSYMLRFDDLHREGHGYSFPCDNQGQVDTNEMPDVMHKSYLYAKTRVGHDFATPRVLIDDPKRST